MRTILLFFALSTMLHCVQAQDGKPEAGPRFYAETAQTEVLYGNAINVTFRLENGRGGKFTTPNWEAAGFDVAGSNQSSSISIVNGVTNAEATYNFAVVPRDTGSLFIPSASIRDGEKEYHTEPLAVHVLPNPDRIVESPRPINPPAAPAPPPAAPKKKIKTTRI